MSDELENKNSEQDEEQVDETPSDTRLEKRRKQTESRRQQAVIRIALIVGIIVFVSIIANYLFFRIDLTKNRIYTLSSASKTVVGNLDDKIVIKAYFTDNLPSPYNNTRRYLQEILDDYSKYSKGNLSYDIISPSDENKLEEEAQKFGIQPVQVQVMKDDRAEAIKAYMGMAILYGGKQEVLPFIGQIENLEYEMTATIRRLTEKNQKKIGVLGGTDMPGLDKIGKATEMLKKYYTFTPVDASKNNPVPNDIALLLVFSPKQQQQQQQQQFQMQQQPTNPVPENVKFAIDQYIMNGGKVIFLPSRVSISSQQQFQIAQVVPTGLEDLLESYGIKLNNNIVKDKECANVQVPMQFGGMQMYTQVPFPWFPRITNINSNLPSFSGVGQVFLSMTNDLDLSLAAAKNIKAEPLLVTSKKSAIDNDITMIQVSGAQLPDTMFKKQNLVVGAIYTGNFNSFYQGKQIPADTTAGSSPVMQPNVMKNQSTETKIIVIGNGEFVTDEFRGPPENTMFFANMIDYLVDDIGMTEIRIKDANPKPLKNIEDSTKKIVKYGLLAVPPVIVLLYGMFRWRRRKALQS